MFGEIFRVAVKTKVMLGICGVWLALFVFATTTRARWKALAIVAVAGAWITAEARPDLAQQAWIFLGGVTVVLFIAVAIGWIR